MEEGELSTLVGKAAVVTGAASGIGRAAVILFAREGAHVLAIDRDAGALERAGDSLLADQRRNRRRTARRDRALRRRRDRRGSDGGRHGAGRGRVRRHRHPRANAGIFGQHVHIQDCPIDAFDRVLQVNVTEW